MLTEAIFICSGEEKELLKFDGSAFEKASPKQAKKGYCGSVVPIDLIQSHTFKIPLGTGEERVSTIVEITMFEEGGLDLETEYAITYVKHPLDYESSWLIEAFAVSHERLHEYYDAAVETTGHIDLLAVPYLVYEALYAYDKADAASVELFLYLGEDASYGVLCKEGRYIAHRRLPSLASIALKAQVSVEALKESLRQRGLEKEKYGPDETLLVTVIQDAFANIVERVAQTVNHKRGIFGIGKVDTILLDFEQETIPGLWELFDSYGFEESRKGALSCCEALEAPLQHRGVEALYLLASAQGKLEAPNLTIFEKRPGFLGSHTGKFVMAAGVAALMTAGWGLFEQMELDGLRTKQDALQVRLLSVEEKSRYFRKKLLEERARRDRVAQKLKKEKQTIMAIDEAADAMMLIKASKAKRQKMMKDVLEAMRRYRLSATSMEQNGSRTMRVDIVTSYARRDRIAKFMKDLVDRGYESVGTDAIRLDEDVYQSRVEIVR
ncbi:hypothetical protein [Hydrogenimonas urashimensis]|uniref:hypothetical protein n=1 Tax=Hydrogenimonas urashimensis TaxID=2740515 RepID=UPI001916A2F8|nr:hypothetical protein [Hydrogenimonas urashimensis]